MPSWICRFLGNWDHKNIPDRQKCVTFRKLQKIAKSLHPHAQTGQQVGGDSYFSVLSFFSSPLWGKFPKQTKIHPPPFYISPCPFDEFPPPPILNSSFILFSHLQFISLFLFFLERLSFLTLQTVDDKSVLMQQSTIILPLIPMLLIRIRSDLWHLAGSGSRILQKWSRFLS